MRRRTKMRMCAALAATVFASTLLAGATLFAGSNDRAPSTDLNRRAAKFGAQIKTLLGERKPVGVKIYYHIDLDGVTSALAMKAFLKRQGVTQFKFEANQYGDREYAVTPPEKDWLAVMVDFAHGKPFIDVYTDHHDRQVGVGKSLHAFEQTPSNASFISRLDPDHFAFNEQDMAIIDMVDSADYAAHKLTPRDAGTFLLDKEREKDPVMRGSVANAKLTAIRNKRDGDEVHGVLNRILESIDNPSLDVLHAAIDREIKARNLGTPEEMQDENEAFVAEARRLIVAEPSIDKIATLTTGASLLLPVGDRSVIFQNGANSKMRYGGYNRYTPFVIHPNADFHCIAWPMGLMQLSKNPFIDSENPYDFGDFLLGETGVLSRFKGPLLNTRISLLDIKRVSEIGVTKSNIQGAVGFSWADFVSLYGERSVEGIDLAGRGTEHHDAIAAANKLFRDLTDREKAVLDQIHVNGWDVVQTNSGGHRDISQISGLLFLPRDFRGGAHKFAVELQEEVARKFASMALPTVADAAN